MTAAVGLDPVFGGDMLEAAIVAGLTSAGATVHRLGPSTAPSVAYRLAEFGADLGVLVSVPRGLAGQAEITFFGADGYQLPDDAEAEIEGALANERMSEPATRPVGRIADFQDTADGYAEHLLASTPHPLDGIRVALDCPSGAALTLASDVYRKAGAEIAVTHIAGP